jgi:hypothetical protein
MAGLRGGKGYLRGQDQIDELMEETSRVGSRPDPKLRKDPSAPVQERRTIVRDVPAPVAPVEAAPAARPTAPTAGRTSFGVGMGDQDRPRRRY